MAEAAQAQGSKKTFHLEIVTPDKQFFIGEAEALVLPALDGSLGVEAGHEPIATAVVPGELRFRQSGEWTYAVVGQGLTEIMPDRVMVLVSAAERPEDIDLKRAEAPGSGRRSALNRSSACGTTTTPRPLWPGPWPG